jgi:hypothetical protein
MKNKKSDVIKHEIREFFKIWMAACVVLLVWYELKFPTFPGLGFVVGLTGALIEKVTRNNYKRKV